MNPQITAEIQTEQEHGRSKYGSGPNDFEHDDRNSDSIWTDCIRRHTINAEYSTPMERRQHLVKIAGLAVSAIESFDRKHGRINPAAFTRPEEKAILQLIDEREEAAEAMSQAYYLVIGKSPEWSNVFGYKQALEEIDIAQRMLREAIKSPQPDLTPFKAPFRYDWNIRCVVDSGDQIIVDYSVCDTDRRAVLDRIGEQIAAWMNGQKGGEQ